MKTTSNFISDTQHIGHALEAVVSDIASKKENHGLVATSLKTGFEDIDRYIGGIRPGTLTVIASRPAIGKTTLALNIASHIALTADLPIFLVSLDLSARALTLRLLSNVGDIDTYKLRTEALDERETGRLHQAQQRLKLAPLFLQESFAPTVAELIMEMQKRVHGDTRPALIIVDSLQQVDPIYHNPLEAGPYEAVMRSLQQFARSSKIPVIVLSNVKRELEERGYPYHPGISDLFAPAIGKYSDVLMFLYRDECYNPDSEMKGVLEIHMARSPMANGTAWLSSEELAFARFK